MQLLFQIETDMSESNQDEELQQLNSVSFPCYDAHTIAVV
jgi:hypothetical protein